MAEVVTVCVNPQCGERTTWFSQPNFHGTKIAAGKFLLSYGIILAGTSATKVFRALKHMGMTCISLTTFFKYQREKLIPSIYLHWKKYQAELLDELKTKEELRNEVGSSPAMEYAGFCRSMEYLLSLVAVKTFVSDRHSSITKHMREKLSDIIHYFDIWHIKKKVTKVLTKIVDVKQLQSG
ncbi:Hypothetical predicted protein [Paramuricea clavata]|uniref:Uncharacterized protein n=1 Tax=Paramuricea clavata TaxID=317549 RepID=A0A7D9LZQ3_PARCT|nr:Hypothetical predicted protein [Paramuricea clavata]